VYDDEKKFIYIFVVSRFVCLLLKEDCYLIWDVCCFVCREDQRGICLLCKKISTDSISLFLVFFPTFSFVVRKVNSSSEQLFTCTRIAKNKQKEMRKKWRKIAAAAASRERPKIIITVFLLLLLLLLFHLPSSSQLACPSLHI
jgi:hypothetical protein